MEMWAHFLKCGEFAREHRRGKRLIMAHVGDAIEGTHHGTRQVVTYVKDEQAEVHTSLMDTFLKLAKFSRKAGDKLYYISGTEVHVHDKEDKIAEDLPAEPNPEGGHVFEHLELEVNGRRVWFVHHGPARGKGANEGNALRNWLRDIYYDALKLGVEPPDVVITGHTHTPTYGNFIASRGDSFHVLHGVICPSWQRKTRFAYKVAPVERNEVGAVFLEIRADGEIRMPVILKAQSSSQQVVRL
jgi:UDP-2,3-diacylglucosamine pyrophosphatase LpxH